MGKCGNAFLLVLDIDRVFSSEDLYALKTKG